MTHFDPYLDTVETIDSVRGQFERSGSRPTSKLDKSTSIDTKARKRAAGRLRTAVWRCKLDAQKRPESDVVGLALLAAVATQPAGTVLDAGSVSIVSAAFADLIARGYQRSEIEKVFRRFRKKLNIRPDFTPTGK
jgi:hypothetical protein